MTASLSNLCLESIWRQSYRLTFQSLSDLLMGWDNFPWEALSSFCPKPWVFQLHTLLWPLSRDKTLCPICKRKNLLYDREEEESLNRERFASTLSPQKEGKQSDPYILLRNLFCLQLQWYLNEEGDLCLEVNAFHFLGCLDLAQFLTCMMREEFSN